MNISFAPCRTSFGPTVATAVGEPIGEDPRNPMRRWCGNCHALRCQTLTSCVRSIPVTVQISHICGFLNLYDFEE